MSLLPLYLSVASHTLSKHKKEGFFWIDTRVYRAVGNAYTLPHCMMDACGQQQSSLACVVLATCALAVVGSSVPLVHQAACYSARDRSLISWRAACVWRAHSTSNNCAYPHLPRSLTLGATSRCLCRFLSTSGLQQPHNATRRQDRSCRLLSD